MVHEYRSTSKPINALGMILLAGLALFLLWPAAQIFLVLFAALLIAVFVNSLAGLVLRWLPILPVLARAGVIAFLILLLSAFFLTAGPSFSQQTSQLSEQLPRAMERLQDVISEQPWNDFLKNLNLGYLRPDAGQVMAGVTGVFSTAFGTAAHIVVILFIGFYLAIQPEIYIQGLLHLIPKRQRDRISQLLQALDHALSWWMLGRFASMATVGVFTTIALTLIGMPMALVLGVIAGVFSFVPYIGPIMSVVPALLVGLLESPMMAFYVIMIYALVQFLEGNFVTPLIQRRAVLLPPAVLLSAQFSMGIFYGLLGIIMATPMAVVAIVVIQVLYVRDILEDQVQLLGQHDDHRDTDAQT
ncbi:MAG: AI-2E family transporter [Lysobacterales bacterium]